MDEYAAAAREVGMGALAAFFGAAGALARITALRDPTPVFRQGFIFRALGEASIGLGCWLLARSAGFGDMWCLAAAWAGGVLGYGVIHDALLRLLNQHTGGKG